MEVRYCYTLRVYSTLQMIWISETLVDCFINTSGYVILVHYRTWPILGLGLSDISFYLYSNAIETVLIEIVCRPRVLFHATIPVHYCCYGSEEGSLRPFAFGPRVSDPRCGELNFSRTCVTSLFARTTACVYKNNNTETREPHRKRKTVWPIDLSHRFPIEIASVHSRRTWKNWISQKRVPGRLIGLSAAGAILKSRRTDVL